MQRANLFHCFWVNLIMRRLPSSNAITEGMIIGRALYRVVITLACNHQSAMESQNDVQLAKLYGSDYG